MHCLAVTNRYMRMYVYKLLQRRAAWGPSPEQEDFGETLEEAWEINAPLPERAMIYIQDHWRADQVK